jgi:hypothetical protein
MPADEKKKIPGDMSILSFMHCRHCIEELPEGISPQNYASYSIGFTEIGLQVWCNRHDCNIVHIDFQGHKHPANIS